MACKEDLRLEDISFDIMTTSEKTFLEVFHDQEPIEQITVKRLIKYFK